MSAKEKKEGDVEESFCKKEDFIKPFSKKKLESKSIAELLAIIAFKNNETNQHDTAILNILNKINILKKQEFKMVNESNKMKIISNNNLHLQLCEYVDDKLIFTPIIAWAVSIYYYDEEDESFSTHASPITLDTINSNDDFVIFDTSNDSWYVPFVCDGLGKETLIEYFKGIQKDME